MTIDGFVHPAFAAVAERFARQFRKPGSGGGALAIRMRGETMVDVWGGFADPHDVKPWSRDTMAMSFSTSKGVISTVVHRLVDRGMLTYDDRVADHWPAFGAAGKGEITVRQLLSHQAGLHDIRSLIDAGEDLLDAETMMARLAAARPDPPPGTGSGYHGFTYGWLVGGLVRAVTGKDVGVLVQSELAEPLGLEGMYVGVPPAEKARVAHTVLNTAQFSTIHGLATRAERFERTRRIAEAFFVEGFDRLLADPERRMLDVEIPAVNGVFTARDLATMYSALANGGSVDGVELLSRRTAHDVGRVQTRTRDYVLGFNMRWRLGYHQAFTTGRMPRRGFGHFGFGGSGAWADPSTGLSLGFVTNRVGSATTPIGDVRLARLGGAALAVVRGSAQ